MKPELTSELKKRFYAQYYGQKVMADRQMPDKTFDIDLTYAERERSYLKLKKLSNISFEELQIVYKLSGYSLSKEEYLGAKAEIDYDYSLLELASWQYLISIGFAIPFHKHSVQELVTVGWVRLTES